MDDARDFSQGITLDHAWFTRCQCGEGLLCDADAPVERGRCPSCGETPEADAVPVYRTRVNGEVTDLQEMDPLGKDAARMYMARLRGDEARTAKLMQVLGIDRKRRTITVGRPSDRMSAKGKKSRGKSPTRRVVPVQRGTRG